MEYSKITFFRLCLLVTVIGFVSGLTGAVVYGYLEKSLTNTEDRVSEIVIEGTDEEIITIHAVEAVSPSVVSIIISKDIRSFANSTGPNVFPFDDFFNFENFFFPQPDVNQDDGESDSNDGTVRRQEIGGGSGFLISSDGLIITNKHVVDDEDVNLTVILNDGRQFEATVIDTDPFNDLSIIKVDAHDLPVVTLGDSDDIRIGQSVIAIGNALGEFRNTVTKGVVSGIDRRVVAGNGIGTSEVIEEAIQTDAAINPGNSGGPLINLKGEVVGVNTAISRSGQLVGFAIPVNTAKRIVESVLKHGKIVRPWLGVRYVLNNKRIAEENNLSIEFGALLLPGGGTGEDAVFPGSPADEAGLLEGDVILAVDGSEIKDGKSLGRIISEYEPGEQVTLTIVREGEERSIEVTLREFEDE